jgi:hypothetical protein
MNSAQAREWEVLYGRTAEVLSRYGRENPFREGDYWLLDENWGRHRLDLEIQNLNLFKTHIIKSLQVLLTDYPNWHIKVQVDVPGTEGVWPGMGVVIYPDEIVDELQRQFLPEEFRNIRY